LLKEQEEAEALK